MSGYDLNARPCDNLDFPAKASTTRFGDQSINAASPKGVLHNCRISNLAGLIPKDATDHDQPERLDLVAERRQLFDDAIKGSTIVIPKDWHNIGFDATRTLARELKAVAGDSRVVDRYSAMVD